MCCSISPFLFLKSTNDRPILCTHSTPLEFDSSCIFTKERFVHDAWYLEIEWNESGLIRGVNFFFPKLLILLSHGVGQSPCSEEKLFIFFRFIDFYWNALLNLINSNSLSHIVGVESVYLFFGNSESPLKFKLGTKGDNGKTLHKMKCKENLKRFLVIKS